MVRKTGIWLYVETSGWKLFVLMCTGAKKKKKKKLLIMLVSYPMAKKKPQNILLSITTFKGIYNDWKELFKSEN